jgi:hypothetical protein
MFREKFPSPQSTLNGNEKKCPRRDLRRNEHLRIFETRSEKSQEEFVRQVTTRFEAANALRVSKSRKKDRRQ